MKRVGIISGTHAYWDDKYEKYFAECDKIWHAGSIGSLEMAQKLVVIKPLRAICDSYDSGDLRRMYHDKPRFKCEDVDVLLTHIGSHPGNYTPQIHSLLFASPPQLFVCEHSHILKVQYDKTLNLLHINPGAAGLRGRHRKRTLIRLTIGGNKFANCETIALSDKNHHP